MIDSSAFGGRGGWGFIDNLIYWAMAGMILTGVLAIVGFVFIVYELIIHISFH